MICVDKEDAAMVDAGVDWDQRVVVVRPCAARESVHVCAVSIRNKNEKKNLPISICADKADAAVDSMVHSGGG